MNRNGSHHTLILPSSSLKNLTRPDPSRNKSNLMLPPLSVTMKIESKQHFEDNSGAINPILNKMKPPNK